MYKIEIYVKLKKDVLDPQGKAIENASFNLGFKDIVQVNQGKYFEVIVKNTSNSNSAKIKAKKLAGDLLVNDIIEDYKIIKIVKI